MNTTYLFPTISLPLHLHNAFRRAYGYLFLHHRIEMACPCGISYQFLFHFISTMPFILKCSARCWIKTGIFNLGDANRWSRNKDPWRSCKRYEENVYNEANEAIGSKQDSVRRSLMAFPSLMAPNRHRRQRKWQNHSSRNNRSLWKRKRNSDSKEPSPIFFRFSFADTEAYCLHRHSLRIQTDLWKLYPDRILADYHIFCVSRSILHDFASQESKPRRQTTRLTRSSLSLNVQFNLTKMMRTWVQNLMEPLVKRTRKSRNQNRQDSDLDRS